MSKLEIEVYSIFRESFGNPKLDDNSTFMDLGGDSLTAMLIISRIRSAFQIELSVEDFFMSDASVKSISALLLNIREASVESNN